MRIKSAILTSVFYFKNQKQITSWRGIWIVKMKSQIHEQYNNLRCGGWYWTPAYSCLIFPQATWKAPQAGRRRIPEPSRNGASAYTFTTPQITARSEWMRIIATVLHGVKPDL